MKRKAAYEIIISLVGTEMSIKDRNKINDSLSVGGALLVSTRLEDDVTVIPVPTITWNIDELWRLAVFFTHLTLPTKRQADHVVVVCFFYI